MKRGGATDDQAMRAKENVWKMEYKKRAKLNKRLEFTTAMRYLYSFGNIGKSRCGA